MKHYSKLSGTKRSNYFLVCLYSLLAFIVVSSVMYTLAMFTAQATVNGEIDFANLEVNLLNSSGATLTSSNFESGYLTTKLVPGDTVDFSTVKVKNTGEADIYCLVRLDVEITKTDSTVTTSSYWYNLSGTAVNAASMPSNTTPATHVAMGASDAIDVTFTFVGELYDNSYKGATVKFTLGAYAVQYANIPSNSTYTSTPLYAAYLIVDSYAVATEFVYEVSADGKYLYFGEYPQTIKPTSVTVSSTPDANGYYLGSDGERYYKYTVNWDLDALGASQEEITAMGMNLASDGEQIMLNGTEYYFRMERLKWRILGEQSDGTTLVVCDNIVQGTAFQPYYTSSGSYYYATDASGNILTDSTGAQAYANNYEVSQLRSFLNNDFYNMAFSTNQRAMIAEVTVDNSASTTNSATNPYICANTLDNVFALSYNDVVNSNYGFEAEAGTQDTARYWATNDFAKATGTMTITAEYIALMGYAEGSEEYELFAPYIGSGLVWLRSPDSIYSYYALGVYIGYAAYDSDVDNPLYGAVPALQIRLP